jgi:hypothetical protein
MALAEGNIYLINTNENIKCYFYDTKAVSPDLSLGAGAGF